MCLFFGRKDSMWQILRSKERNELERLHVKNAFSISCVKMVNSKQEEQQSLEKKEETPIHFLIVVFGLFFFSGTFSLFFIEKKTTATSLRLWLNSEKCVFVYFFSCSSFDRVFSLVPFSLLFLLLVPKTAGSNPKSLSI